MSAIVDIVGMLAFTIPLCLILITLSWPVFERAWVSGEMSQNAGGLIRWPALLLIPAGFAVLLTQCVSELIKRVAFLTGARPNSLDKEAGPSAEQELAEAIKKHQVAPQVVSYVEANHEMVDQPKQGDRK